MAPTTVFEILAFHKIDRFLYEKLVALIGNCRTARSVLSLWLWLELIGIDVITNVRSINDSHLILRFMAEAQAILGCLCQGAQRPFAGETPIPLTASFAAEQISLQFFYLNGDAAVQGIVQFMDGVGKVIFDDYLKASFQAYEEAVKEAEWQWGQGVPVPRPELPVELAQPYIRDPLPTPEDRRSMFITFSRGLPIGHDTIAAYFTEKWGECLEKVMIEKTEPGVMPMYGRIVFISESYINLAFNGEQLFKFTINGRNMWVRKYVARRN